MKSILILTMIFSGSLVRAEDWAKITREERCKVSGGAVAGHGAAENQKKDGAPFVGPIDCTCGGKRFNPLHEGDFCRDGKILSSIQHYCEDSKGILAIQDPDAKTEEALKPKNGKAKWPLKVQKCLCGDKAFEPTKTTVCADGKVSQGK